MKHRFTMISAVVAAALMAFQAQAETVSFKLSGSGVSGTINLTTSSSVPLEINELQTVNVGG